MRLLAFRNESDKNMICTFHENSNMHTYYLAMYTNCQNFFYSIARSSPEIFPTILLRKWCWKNFFYFQLFGECTEIRQKNFVQKSDICLEKRWDDFSNRQKNVNWLNFWRYVKRIISKCFLDPRSSIKKVYFSMFIWPFSRVG